MHDDLLLPVAIARSKKLISLQHATVVRGAIIRVLNQQHSRAIVDFNQYTETNDAFLLHTFGALYWLQLNPDDLRDRLKISNLSESDKQRLAALLPQAKADIETRLRDLTEIHAFELGGMLRVDPMTVDGVAFPERLLVNNLYHGVTDKGFYEQRMGELFHEIFKLQRRVKQNRMKL